MWTALMAVFAAIMGGITNVINMYSQKSTNEANIQAAQDMQAQQQEYARENAATANAETERMYWELYSPQAKVQQYKDAGLSVGLMYGGSGTGGTTAQMAAAPTQGAPYLNPPIFGNIMDQITNALAAGSQTELNKATEQKTNKETESLDYKIKETIANTKKIEEEAKTQVVTRNYTETQTKLAELELKFNTENYETQLQTAKQQLDLIKETTNKTRKEILGLNIDNEYKSKLYESTLDLNEKLSKKYVAEKLNIMADTKLKDAQKKLAEAQKKLTESQEELTDEQKVRTQREIREKEEEIRKLTVIANEYEIWGYKVTECQNWSNQAISILMNLEAEHGETKNTDAKGRTAKNIIPQDFDYTR